MPHNTARVDNVLYGAVWGVWGLRPRYDRPYGSGPLKDKKNYMIRYLYKKLIAFRLKPFILSKVNLWNILNSKNVNHRTTQLLFLFKNLTKLSLGRIATLGRIDSWVKYIYAVVMLPVLVGILILLF